VSGEQASRAARIVIVPGLAVRRYARPAGLALRRAGHDVSLLRPPAWHGAPADLARYGGELARQLDRREHDIALLVGLSVGTQAAAVAAARSRRVRRLLLVSPTVDPAKRSWPDLVGAWLRPGKGDEAPGFLAQAPDWARAGIPRIALGIRSALQLRLERVMPQVAAEVTVVHAEHDSLGSAGWAASVAEASRGRFSELAGAPHSWPVGDEAGFVRFVRDMLR
jgi:hypothetical protein